jgi:hypothetical protein
LKTTRVPNDVRGCLSTVAEAADKGGMDNLQSLTILLVAGIGLGLYILRRRSRLGRRTPKF